MPTTALIFPTLGLDVGARRSGLSLSWSLGPACDSFIAKGLTALYGGVPYYDDLVNFPYRLKAEDLAADIWYTGNILPCAQALRRLAALGSAAKPSYVIAHLPELEQVPASVRALRDTGLFAQIEWVTEKCFDHGCNIDASQHFLCGTLKKARELELAEAADALPALSALPARVDPAAMMSASRWIGPLALDPKADDGHPIGIISLFRHGAVTWMVEALTRRLVQCEGLAEYREEDAFARFMTDASTSSSSGGGGGELIVKLFDGIHNQRLLDGSLENFYAAFPENGCCQADGLLIRRPRDVEVVTRPLPPFTSVRNVRYMAALLGLPEKWMMPGGAT